MRPSAKSIRVPIACAVLCISCSLFLGCGKQGSGSAANGGNAATGGAPGSGGQVAQGGNSGSGGTADTGATTSQTTTGTGGITDSGGATGVGGTTSTTSSGGAASTGGAGTGGAVGTGGGAASGGVGDGGVDARTSVDVSRTGGSGSGGITATGGGPGTGGAVGTGGSTGAGGGTGVGSDRCEVGVYDAASPPKVLSLGGTYSTHDPSAIAASGTYYLFCTGLGAWTSTNLTTWRSSGRPFAVPSWVAASVSGVGDLWAPDISQFGGKYHLYYAASTFGSNKSCIGHATRDSLASGSWTDDGAATICSNVGTSDNWNAIDPNVIIDTDGNPWMVLGSFWSGIKIIQLDAEGKRVGTTVTAIANRPSNGGAIEGPFMVRRCGYYYLFTSWDTCCKGASSTYNIRVVRGTSVTGPFADKAGTAATQGGGTLIAEGDAAFAGPGGQSVMFDGNKAYLVYHAYAKPSGAITLRIADLVWDADGWPVPVGP
jgi:arabinan endo-1,5-alpha-L-arabinosidase